MERQITVLWDKETPFEQYLTDRGFICEVVTPQIVAAPFFSWKACKLLLVPAGFGNAFFSGILKDLRATSTFITNFVKAGGTLLVCGAFSGKNAYNWLPRTINYVRAEHKVQIDRLKQDGAATIVETDECFCDGYFDEVGEGWEVVLAARAEGDEKAILVVSKYGAGRIIATTIHEYPTEQFIAYCVRK